MSTPQNQTNKPKFGIITLAMGEYYQELALVLLESLRRYMPHIEVAVVTDRNHGRLAEYFDHVISLDMTHGTTLKQKLYLNQYSPFQKTMFIDADSIALRSFQRFVDELIRQDYAFTSSLGDWAPTRSRKSEWVFDPLLLEQKIGSKDFHYPHGGLYFWDRDEGEKWFSLAREFYEKFDESYGLNRLPDHGFNEEIAFGCAIVFFKKRDGFDHYFPYNKKLMTTTYFSVIWRNLFGKLMVRRRRLPFLFERPCFFHFFHRNTKKRLYQSIKEDALKRLRKRKN